ncbi:MAG: hypothetical protein WCP97_06130 [bacterium]
MRVGSSGGYKVFQRFANEAARGITVEDKKEQRHLRRNLREYAKLTHLLRSFENNPKVPNGEQKANLILGYLRDNGVNAEVIKVVNPEYKKEKDPETLQYLYNVVIRIGNQNSPERRAKGTRILTVVHHDTVRRDNIDTQQYTLKETDGVKAVHAAWIQDDSAQAAAAILDAIEAQKEWKKNGKSRNGELVYVITDREERYCLGMRGLLEYWDSIGELGKFDAVIDGESNKQDVATGHRGRHLMTFQMPNTPSVAATYRQFYTMLQHSQRKIWNDSPEAQVGPTTVAPLYGTFSRDSSSHMVVDCRTNTTFDGKKTLKILQDSLTTNNRIEHNLLTEADLAALIIDPENKTITVRATRQHPASFNPTSDASVLPVIDRLFSLLTSEEAQQINRLTIGSPSSNSNSTPETASISFSSLPQTLSIDALLSRITNKTQLASSLDSIGIGSELVQNALGGITIETDPLSAREAIHTQENHWLPTVAVQHLNERVNAVLGGLNESRKNFAQFMGDAGRLAIYPDIWRKIGEAAVIFIGVGDPKWLHGDERLTQQDLIFGSIMYRGLPLKLWQEANKHLEPTQSS